MAPSPDVSFGITDGFSCHGNLSRARDTRSYREHLRDRTHHGNHVASEVCGIGDGHGLRNDRCVFEHSIYPCCVFVVIVLHCISAPHRSISTRGGTQVGHAFGRIIPIIPLAAFTPIPQFSFLFFSFHPSTTTVSHHHSTHSQTHTHTHTHHVTYHNTTRHAHPGRSCRPTSFCSIVCP